LGFTTARGGDEREKGGQQLGEVETHQDISGNIFRIDSYRRGNKGLSNLRRPSSKSISLSLGPGREWRQWLRSQTGSAPKRTQAGICAQFGDVQKTYKIQTENSMEITTIGATITDPKLRR
jgi:hypothetical protein